MDDKAYTSKSKTDITYFVNARQKTVRYYASNGFKSNLAEHTGLKRE